MRCALVTGVQTCALPISGPDFATLGVRAEQAAAALAAFRISCPSVQRRTDTSGLALGADWTESCVAAKTWADTDALAFFTRYFGTVQRSEQRRVGQGCVST